MNPATCTLQGRENMFKRLNKFILSSVMGIRLRPAGATILGGFAGLSLTANILPTAISMTTGTEQFILRWNLGGFAVYSVMIWAVGGWAAQRIGLKRFGALILGFVGLASGLTFTALGVNTEMMTLLTGGGVAMLYGAIGGMIIADALRNPPEEKE
jgi:hypothetical protein